MLSLLFRNSTSLRNEAYGNKGRRAHVLSRYDYQSLFCCLSVFFSSSVFLASFVWIPLINFTKSEDFIFYFFYHIIARKTFLSSMEIVRSLQRLTRQSHEIYQVRKAVPNVQRTILKSVVGTLDLSIRYLLPGETFPGVIIYILFFLIYYSCFMFVLLPSIAF